MELKDFIKKTLIEITQGVKEAQEECSKSGALINPTYTPYAQTKDKGNLIKHKAKSIEVTSVNFKVAITVSEGEEKNKGINILSSVIKLGASNTSTDSIQNANIIEFKVPIILPSIDDSSSD